VLQNFRDFATQRGAPFERIDLVPLIKSVTRTAKATGFCPVRETLAPAVFVAGDARALADAFNEILENAQEAMQVDTVDCRLITVKASIEALQADGGSVAVIEFADTGPGVPHEHKAKIFEPLFTTRADGTGLGLTIVWDIIQRHKGAVVETGVPGKGARFVVRLPALHSPGDLDE
jgi:two-component system nitrogen regulation sensor histidine kinase NtrY